MCSNAQNPIISNKAETKFLWEKEKQFVIKFPQERFHYTSSLISKHRHYPNDLKVHILNEILNK